MPENEYDEQIYIFENLLLKISFENHTGISSVIIEPLIFVYKYQKYFTLAMNETNYALF